MTPHTDHPAPHPLTRLKQLYTVERQDIWIIVGYGIGIGIMSLATPIAVQALVSTITFGALYQPLLVLSLILLASVSFSNLLVGIQFYVVEMLQRRVFVRFFGAAADRVHRASAETHDREHVTELANRFFDVMTLQKTGAVLLLEGGGYLLQTGMGMILLAFYHPILLAFDVLLAACLAVILFGLGRGGIASAIRQSKAKYAAAGWLEDIAHNPNLFRSGGGPEFVAHHSDRIARDYLDASAAHFRILMGQSIGALSVHAVASTALLGLGGWMVIDRQLTLGQLVAAELVVSAMIYGLTRLGKTLENFYEMMAGIDKLGHLLDLPAEQGGSQPLPPTSAPAAVTLHAVSFHYPGGPPLLDRIELELKPGDHAALMGPGGAGKGTLLDLMFGLRWPSAGSVLLDGHDLRSLDLDSLRRQVALVHRPEILAGSVMENLSLDRPDVYADEAFAALEAVGLLDEVLALPQGLQTQLNHHGMPLLPEQLLRLCLARALAGRPRLLLLDEVFERVVAHRVEAIAARILAPDAPWTAVVSTQHPAALDRCKRVFRLEQGQLFEPQMSRGAPHG